MGVKSNLKTSTRLQGVPGRKRKTPTPHVKKVSFKGRECFESVLSSPFFRWNDLEALVEECQPDWTYTHRSFIVLNLIRFMELKVLLEEFAKEPLLAPTKLVSKVWRSLILETDLYRDVIYGIQAFHARPKKMIHHSRLKNVGREVYDERLDRTQRLFEVYYGEHMTDSFASIELDLSMTDTSDLTDAFAAFKIPFAGCTPSFIDMDSVDAQIVPPTRVVSRTQVFREMKEVEHETGKEAVPNKSSSRKSKSKKNKKKKSKSKSKAEQGPKLKPQQTRRTLLKKVFCVDAVKDILMWRGDSSLEDTVILEEIEEDESVVKYEFFKRWKPRKDMAAISDEFEPIYYT